MFGDKSRMPFKLCFILQCSEICPKTFQEVTSFTDTYLRVMKMFFTKNWKDLLCGGVSRKKTCRLHDLFKQGFPTWGTCTPRCTIANPKGYIQGYQQKSEIYSRRIYFQMFTHISEYSFQKSLYGYC